MKANRAKEILTQLAETLPSRTYGNDGLAYRLEEAFYSNKPRKVDNFEIALEDRFGGEDQGTQYWMVLSITNTDTDKVTYVRFNGWYESYSGHEWHDSGNDLEIVEPKEVKVTEWETV